MALACPVAPSNGRARADIVAAGSQALEPSRRRPILDHDRRSRRRRPGVEPGLRSAERPARRGRRRGQRLGGMEQSGDELGKDLRLSVSAHRPEHRRKLPIATDQGGAQGVRRTASRAELGWMSFHQREAEATILQVDRRRRLDEAGPEARGVGLDQADGPSVGIRGAQVRGVSVRRSPPSVVTRRPGRAAHHGQ